MASGASAVAADTVSLQAIRAERDSGNYQAAFQHLNALTQSSQEDLSLDLVLLARKAKGHLPPTQITQLYRDAVESSFRKKPTAENLDLRLLIRLAAAEHFSSIKQHTLATRPLLAALEDLVTVNPESLPARRVPLIRFALRTAGEELASGHHRNAERLYRAVFETTQKDEASGDHEKAILGLGWTLASDDQRAAQAAELLRAFVRDHPSHPDAPQACAQAIRCARVAGDQAMTDQLTGQFLRRWPTHRLASRLAADAANSGVPKSELLDWLNQVSPEKWPPELVSAVIGDSLSSNQFTRAAKTLATIDETGQHIADALNRLTQNEEVAAAERLAVVILALDADEEASFMPMACESVCRWAGRTSRWSMLALHAESVKPSDRESRTRHTERLFAEALMREGDSESARAWWSHLVDTRKATDFATRLRLAECSVAHADIDDATSRIAQARSVASDSSGEALLDFLEAELAIRRLQFEPARDRYEAIIRDASIPASLRGRAQWMIAETHLMQQHYADAIDAYRRVEGIDPQSRFVPASLVQAGKSFEQLGRTREAAVCYAALLSRFADSRHASEARRRLAELPAADENKQSIRR